MAELRDHALLLRSIPYSDSSLILHLFTQNHGRISLMARGARRPKSSFRGGLMPMHQLHIRWREPRTGNMGTLLEVQRLTPLLPEHLMLAGQDLLAKASTLFPDGVEQGYMELQHAFHLLRQRPEHSGQLAAIWSMLERAGWAANFKHCWHCNDTINLEHNMMWYQAHLLCMNCAHNHGIKLSSGCLKSLYGHLNREGVKLSVQHIKIWKTMIDTILTSQPMTT
ncbi:MAG: DNA repair protein RecO [Ghiorsea sp.]|nr:DNA repair protein RecO [Ghiorsea sp.]